MNRIRADEAEVFGTSRIFRRNSAGSCSGLSIICWRREKSACPEGGLGRPETFSEAGIYLGHLKGRLRTIEGREQDACPRENWDARR